MQSDGNTKASGVNSEDSSLSPLTFYPAYCFKASPTWFTWVKLTAHDIHTKLESRQGFHHSSVVSSSVGGGGDTLLLFYQNHPIQFVQLVGVVVNVEEYYEKYWLFTIDDGSGATIDITCRKPLPPKPAADHNGVDVGSKPPPQDPDEKDRIDAMSKLDNGVVVQVKGQISTFRHVRQVTLERIVIVPDTNQEMRLISARTTFFRNVLSRPWVVTDVMRNRLLKEAADDQEASKVHLLKHRKKELEKHEREKRHEMRIQSRYERDEMKRAAAAQEAKAAGHLLRSSV